MQQRLRFSISAVLLCLAGLAVSRPAQGRVVVPGDVYFADPVFPADGLIVGELTCFDQCTIDDLTFYDWNEEAVDGHFIELDGLLGEGGFAFQPDEPLSEGAYSARVAENYATYFEVKPPTDELPVITFTVAPRYEGAGRKIECVEPKSEWVYFYEQEITRASLTLSAAGQTASQYSYRVVGDDIASPSFQRELYDFSLGSIPREICFHVEGAPLAGGEAVVLSPSCLDTALIETLGLHDVDTRASAKYLLPHCTIPPEGYEDAWCAVFEGRICSTVDQPCWAAAEYCGFDPAESTGTSSSGENATSSNSTTSDSTGSGAGTTESAPTTDSGKETGAADTTGGDAPPGCSSSFELGRTSKEPAPRPLLLLGLSALAWLARRTRRRRSSSGI